MGTAEHSWGAEGPHAIEVPDPAGCPDPQQTVPQPDAPGGIGRRAFMWSAVRGSIGLAAGLTLPARLFAQAGSTLGAAPAAPGGVAFRQPESTRRMAALLAKISREADPLRNPFRNAEQAALLRAMLEKATDPQQAFQVRMRLAWQLLDSGEPEGALKQYEIIKQTMMDNKVPLEEQREPEWLTFQAMCHLRVGEIENCVGNHNSASCMFPIQGGGVHTLQRGSRGAVAALTELLGKYPGDLRARWLLNIAYMTLGEYPGKVPAEWLLDPKLFASEYDIKHFPDIAGSVGLDLDGLAGGVVLEDFDNDGFLDLMVSSWGLNGQLRLFRNNGDGTFTERTEEAGLMGLTGGLNMIHCDYNNDGYMDVLVLRGAWLGTEGKYPCSLLRNNGDFTFTDVTEEAGLLRFHPTQTAVWFDYNNDGWLDLFIANESKDPAGDPNPCELFRNNGDGTFTECAAEHGVNAVGYFKAVVSADYNNDGRPDLFLSRLDGEKILFRNDGPAGADTSARAPWKFTDVAEAAGVTEPPSTFTCWFFDYNNDGWPDILLNGYAIADVGDIAADYLGLPYSGQRAKLYRNNGDGTFTDASKECGVDKMLLTMGANFGDLDNDGWLDFYVGTGNPDLSVLIPNRMFRNDGGRRFQDVTTAGGFGQLQKGHAVAFGDINNTGTQDIYSVVGGAVETDHAHNQLFMNPGHGNNWLKLRLEGVRTNRAAIGARIKVVVQGEEGERAIHRTVGSGGSFGSTTLRQEIGVGRATAVKRVEVFWPVSGATQVLTGLEVNNLYHVKEGADTATKVELRSFKWPAS
jgi:VCBS repeat protein/ASPIC/UnbV protein